MLSLVHRHGDTELAQLVRRFGTAHFHEALPHSVTLGWCRQWRQGKGVHFAGQSTAVLASPRPVYDPAAQHHYEGSGGGTRNTAAAFAKAAVLPTAAPPPPHRRRRYGGSFGGPGGLHTFSESHGSSSGAGSADGFRGMRAFLFRNIS